jgi:hypothetical protein
MSRGRFPRWLLVLLVVGGLVGIVVLIVAVADGGGHHGHYGYSASDRQSFHTVQLLAETRPQPHIEWADPLLEYLAPAGIECPIFESDVSFGSTDPWGGECWRVGGKRDLYYLKTYKTSAEKLESVQGSVSGCEFKLDHEYWIEGPNWYVEVHDLDQADLKADNASTRQLAFALANATGARLYRAC